jgi:hypothetical protein
MTLSTHEVARWTRCDSEYERNLLSAVRRGHRTKRDLNPYKQDAFKQAWHFGHCKASRPFELVEQKWLEMRKKEWEWLANRYRRDGGPPGWIDPVTNETPPVGKHFPAIAYPDDFQLESFGWKRVGTHTEAFRFWKSNEEVMKAQGFRVVSAHDGPMLIRKDATLVSVQPANHRTAQIIEFPRSRIVRLIVGGKPVDEAAGNEAA